MRKSGCSGQERHRLWCWTSEAGQHGNALTASAAFWSRHGTMLVQSMRLSPRLGTILPRRRGYCAKSSTPIYFLYVSLSFVV
jgi:hypothetical protein